MRLILVTLLFLGIGCSSKQNFARKYGVPKVVNIPSVPFSSQTEFQCGPSTLYMVMKFRGLAVTEESLKRQAFTPGKKGSLQADMISAVRRNKLLPILVNDFKDLLIEINSQNPIIILQNLGLSWYPRWHYAVAKGFDLSEDMMILHSGVSPDLKMKLSTFENTWQKSKNWGLLIVSPGQIPATVSETEMLQAVVQLEEMGHLPEAEQSYTAILKKWPLSFGGILGLGNVLFTQKKFNQSTAILHKASANFPTSGIVWHNYAWALWEVRKKKEAKQAASQGLLFSEDLLPAHVANLNEILRMH